MMTMMTEEIKTAPAVSEVKQTQTATPKFSLKQTSAAKKRNRPFPKFTQGEMLPWKGVWFRVSQVAPPEEGKHNGMILLEPMIERVYDTD